MEKRDSESGHVPVEDEKDIGHAQHAEYVLDRFPDPDAGLSEDERAAIVRWADVSDDVVCRLTLAIG